MSSPGWWKRPAAAPCGATRPFVAWRRAWPIAATTALVFHSIHWPRLAPETEAVTGQCCYKQLEILWEEAAAVGLTWQVKKVQAAIDKLRADIRTAAEWHAAMAAELMPADDGERSLVNRRGML